MRSSLGKLGAVVAFGACVYPSAGCGSSRPSNFYDSSGLANGGSGLASGGSGLASGGSGSPDTSGGGGMAANAGASGVGASGSFGNGGQSASGGNSGGMGNPSNAPCSPAKDVSGGMSGPFGTTAGVCLRVTEEIAGWNCSNFDGRSLKVNGQTVPCGQLPLPDKIDGAYYFDASAGVYDYASLYWF